MDKKHLSIDGIPSLLWGEPTGKLFIAVHGDLSSKEDPVIALRPFTDSDIPLFAR
jgi:hypothetical protein